MTGSLATLETDSLMFSSTRARYPGSSNSGSAVTLLAALDSLNLTISGLEANVSKPVTEARGEKGSLPSRSLEDVPDRFNPVLQGTVGVTELARGPRQD